MKIIDNITEQILESDAEETPTWRRAHLFPKEREIQLKLWRKKKGYTKEFNNFMKQFRDLYLNYPRFRKLFHRIVKDGNYFVDEVFWIIENKLDNINLEERIKMIDLNEDLQNLKYGYHRIVCVKKNDKGNFIFFSDFDFKIPYIIVYKIRGQKVEIDFMDIENGNFDSYWEIRRKYQVPFDEIDIEDQTRLSQTNQIEALMDQISFNFPTIIKYRRKWFNRLLVSIPSDLDISTFFKKYGRILTKIHNDFYKTTFKGRREESFRTDYEKCRKVKYLRETERKKWREIAREILPEYFSGSNSHPEAAISLVRAYYRKAKHIS